MTELAEELRKQINELLDEPNEAVVDALLVYATDKVAHVAGAALTARWRAEDALTEARAAIGRVEALADHYAAQVREVEDANGGPIPWTNTMANVVAHVRRAVTEPKPPKGWIRDPNGAAEGEATIRPPESNADARTPVSTPTEAHGETGEAQEASQ